MLCASYHKKTKWRPNRPKITITRLICHLEMKFRRLYLGFRGQPTRWNRFQHGIYYPSTRNKDGGCETGSSCKSAYMPLRNEISTAIPMFSWSANTSKCFQHGIHYPSTRNQDGGCETGSSCKSPYMPLRNGISTATTMFSWSANTSE